MINNKQYKQNKRTNVSNRSIVQPCLNSARMLSKINNESVFITFKLHKDKVKFHSVSTEPEDDSEDATIDLNDMRHLG